VYQEAKKKALSAGKYVKPEFRKGFIVTGLFAKSRHPNFFAEQCIWVCIYLFSVAATGRILNWSITGSLLLMLLF